MRKFKRPISIRVASQGWKLWDQEGDFSVSKPSVGTFLRSYNVFGFIWC